jgi:hypothetical protein
MMFRSKGTSRTHTKKEADDEKYATESYGRKDALDKRAGNRFHVNLFPTFLSSTSLFSMRGEGWIAVLHPLTRSKKSNVRGHREQQEAGDV